MAEKPHILTVTENTTPTRTELLFALNCQAVTDECRAYDPCEVCGPAVELPEGGVLHGVHHLRHDSVLYAATDRCGLVENEDPSDLAVRVGAGVGRHEVPIDVFAEPEL